MDASGNRCLYWRNSDQYSDRDFPQEGKTNAMNFCRSPDDYLPKCFINNYNTLSSCSVPKCNGCAAVPYVKYASFNLNYELDKSENTARDGSVLTYRCASGDLVGPNSLVCQNGRWGDALPKCSGILMSYH